MALELRADKTNPYAADLEGMNSAYGKQIQIANTAAPGSPEYMAAQAEMGRINGQAAEQKRKHDLYELGMGPDGAPLKAEWVSSLDPSGKLKSEYMLSAQPDVQVNLDSYNEVKKRALGEGPSTWAQLAAQKQALEQQNAMDSARTQSLGAQNQALSGLAMRGGVSGGARNRMAAMGLKSQLMAQQGVGNQGMQARYNIGLQDESNRTDMLKNLATLDQEKAKLDISNRQYKTNVDQYNLGNLANEIGSKRNYDTNLYNQRMQAYGANKTADAQAKSGGGK
jgi:hypothetical protein